jgi:cytochrome c oxidase subunit 4
MNGNGRHIVRSRTSITVWLVLLLLTGLTVAAAGLQMGRWSMASNLLIASTKAGLVLWFFMHLKYETLLFKLLLLIPIATITIIIWLTFYDIWYR